MTSRTTAELVIYAARFVALSTDDGKTSCSDDLVVLTTGDLLGFLESRTPVSFRRLLRVDTTLDEDLTCQVIGVTAKQDVRTTSGHVGCDGHSALTPRLGDDGRLALVMLGVSDNQIESVSLGEEKPRCTESTESCFAENRRSDMLYSGEF